MRIVKELVEIWPNEVCDILILGLNIFWALHYYVGSFSVDYITESLL